MSIGKILVIIAIIGVVICFFVFFRRSKANGMKDLVKDPKTGVYKTKDEENN